MNVPSRICSVIAIGFAWLATTQSLAESVGQVKVSTGFVSIERAGKRLPGPVGTNIEGADSIVTGADGSAGITFVDNSRLSVGPNSTLAITRFKFDQTTHEGGFDTALKRGTLSVVSGKLAKRSPDAMTVSTPSTILGVRGTEFVVKAGE